MFAGPNGSGKSTLKDEIAKALLENDSARTPEDIKALKDDFEKSPAGHLCQC
jgi:predicted ABC-type ATPase